MAVASSIVDAGGDLQCSRSNMALTVLVFALAGNVRLQLGGLDGGENHEGKRRREKEKMKLLKLGKLA